MLLILFSFTTSMVRKVGTRWVLKLRTCINTIQDLIHYYSYFVNIAHGSHNPGCGFNYLFLKEQNSYLGEKSSWTYKNYWWKSKILNWNSKLKLHKTNSRKLMANILQITSTKKKKLTVISNPNARFTTPIFRKKVLNQEERKQRNKISRCGL